MIFSASPSVEKSLQETAQYNCNHKAYYNWSCYCCGIDLVISE